MTPKPLSDRSTSRRSVALTAAWIPEVTDCSIIVGVDPHDFRLVITLGADAEDDQITRVYPCAVCRWDEACEDGCHA
jgi:hypothetical protein